MNRNVNGDDDDDDISSVIYLTILPASQTILTSDARIICE
jgi:hypothetical protein